MAVQGELAARYLARAIYYNFVLLDFPELDRDGRLALFPSDPDAGRFFRPYPIDFETVPALAARQLINEADTREEWRQQADILFEAGFLSSLRMNLRIVFNQNYMLQSESVQYIEPRVGPDDQIWYEIWFLRGSESRLIETFMKFQPEEMTARQAFWDGPVWGPEQDAQFSAALSDKRWTAIRALGLLRLFEDEEITPLVEVAPDVARMADLWLHYGNANRPNQPAPPTTQELQSIGTVIAKDAERSPDLTPLRRACETACPTIANECMAVGAITNILSFAGTHHIEFGPALPLDVYNTSPRADRDFLARMGMVYETSRVFALEMPACFKQAALVATH